MTWSTHTRFLNSRNKQAFIIFPSRSLIQYCLILFPVYCSEQTPPPLSLQQTVPNKIPANHAPCSGLGISSRSVLRAGYPGPQFRNPLPRPLLLSAWAEEPLPPYWVFSRVATPALSRILRISLLALMILSLELGNEADIVPSFLSERHTFRSVPLTGHHHPNSSPFLIPDVVCLSLIHKSFFLYCPLFGYWS